MRASCQITVSPLKQVKIHQKALFPIKFFHLRKKHWTHGLEWSIVNKFKRLQDFLDAEPENRTVMRLLTRGDEMEVGQIWAFGVQLAVTLALSVGWLLFCRILRSIRVRIRVTFAYLLAAAVALLACVLYAGGPTWSGSVASLLVMTFLYVRWKRLLTMQSLEADTIIGFELT